VSIDTLEGKCTLLLYQFLQEADIIITCRGNCKNFIIAFYGGWVMKNEKVAQLSEGSELLQQEPEVTSVNLGNSDLAIQ